MAKKILFSVLLVVAVVAIVMVLAFNEIISVTTAGTIGGLAILGGCKAIWSKK